MMLNPRSFVITITACLLLATAATAAPTSSNLLIRPKATPLAPEFVLQDIDGKQYSLSEYRGRVVVINFWASWCPPCIAEMPSLQNAADQLARHDIPLLGIGVGENRDSVKRFLTSMPLRFPLLLDTGSEVAEAWTIPSLPVTLVIDQEGKIALVAVGKRRWDSPEIIEQIISLKKAS